MNPCDPATLNGDLPLTRAQDAAYVNYHTRRNAANRTRSLDMGILSSRSPVWGWSLSGGSSPARAILDAYFWWAAAELRPAFDDRRVTIVDLGCGNGGRIGAFAAAGFQGEFIGLDIAASPKWPTRALAGLQPRLILGDLHRFDPAELPPIDLLISTTSLEHLRDDAGIVRKFEARLAPGSAQVHFVPAEASLDLYGKHGWRQYSPACVRALFPSAEIHRFGGPFSNELHLQTIRGPYLRGEPMLGQSRPRLYAVARSVALVLDRLLGCPRPSMYAAFVRPDGHRRSSGQSPHEVRALPVARHAA